MKIYIPTRGRLDRQITAQYIPVQWKSRTRLVTNEDTTAEPHGIQVLKCPKTGISNVRQWITDTCEDEQVFMLDDDLHFFRKQDDKLQKCIGADIDDMFNLMEEWLESGINCVGLTSRFGNNWIKSWFVNNTRPCMAYGFNRSVLSKNNIRFDAVDVCEDYHVFLSLLKLGHQNQMTAEFVVESPSVNKNGGCAEWRTEQHVIDSMNKLVELHSPYVSLRDVKGDTQGFKIGKELRVQWKRAYNDSDQDK